MRDQPCQINHRAVEREPKQLVPCRMLVQLPKQWRNDEHNWKWLATRREYKDLVVSSATAMGDSQEKEPTTKDSRVAEKEPSAATHAERRPR